MIIFYVSQKQPSDLSDLTANQLIVSSCCIRKRDQNPAGTDSLFLIMSIKQIFEKVKDKILEVCIQKVFKKYDQSRRDFRK